MSDFSLTLVLRFKTSKIINDMAKVQIKSEKITAFGGKFFVLGKFDRIPAYHCHGCKLLPIHRGIAAHGRPLWNHYLPRGLPAVFSGIIKNKATLR